MAVQKQDGLHTDTGESASDLTDKEFYFCKRNSSGTIELCGSGDAISGVISEGRTTGKHTSFNTRGNPILKAIAGTAITIGQKVQSDAAGKAMPGDVNDIGTARNNVNAGEYVSIDTFTTSV